LEDVEEATFAQVRDHALKYVGNKVQFDMYFGKAGSFYRPFLSLFTSDLYSNFSAWEYGAPLWNKDARANVYLFFTWIRAGMNCCRNWVPCRCTLRSTCGARSVPRAREWPGLKSLARV